MMQFHEILAALEPGAQPTPNALKKKLSQADAEMIAFAEDIEDELARLSKVRSTLESFDAKGYSRFRLVLEETEATSVQTVIHLLEFGGKLIRARQRLSKLVKAFGG